MTITGGGGGGEDGEVYGADVASVAWKLIAEGVLRMNGVHWGCF